MNIQPKEFLKMLLSGKTEADLNKKNYEPIIDPKELRKMIKNGHTHESAIEFFNTDYSNGFTICKCCGSFYQLGEGFTKHLSNGCQNCEGEEKHKVYHVNASKPKDGGFPARYMSVMFDDGMHYTKDKLQIGAFKREVKNSKK